MEDILRNERENKIMFILTFSTKLSSLCVKEEERFFVYQRERKV